MLCAVWIKRNDIISTYRSVRGWGWYLLALDFVSLRAGRVLSNHQFWLAVTLKDLWMQTNGRLCERVVRRSFAAGAASGSGLLSVLTGICCHSRPAATASILSANFTLYHAKYAVLCAKVYKQRRTCVPKGRGSQEAMDYSNKEVRGGWEETLAAIQHFTGLRRSLPTRRLYSNNILWWVLALQLNLAANYL